MKKLAALFAIVLGMSSADADIPNYTPPTSFAPLVEKTSPAVVSVYSTHTVEGMIDPFSYFFGRPQETPSFEQKGLGSGFIISQDGYILTNNHVVKNSDELTVELGDGRDFDAEIIGTDERMDVALIKIKGDDLPTLSLGSSDKIQVGDWVVAIGNPLGLSHTVTAGIVSAKGRVIGATTYDDFIQTDASINQGNSGGPLLNVKGEVVGINTAVSAQGQGIAFAVPIDMVKERIEELKSTGQVKRGWLGIKMQTLDDDLAQAMGLKEGAGALIAESYPDTPADNAGLQSGDVIIEIDSQKIESSDDLLKYIGRKAPGDKVRVKINRQGQIKDLKIELGARPDEEELAQGIFQDQNSKSSPKANSKTNIGATFRQGDALKGAPVDARGRVVVVAVEPGSAASGRLKRGDIVIKVNNQEVSTVEQIEEHLQKSEGVVLFQIQRDGSPLFVAVRIE